MEYKVILKKLNMNYKINSHVRIKLDNIIVRYQN